MAITDESGIGTTMLVGPTSATTPYPVFMGGNNGGNNGFGDGNGWWIVLLIILLAAGNGFGNNNGGGFGAPYVINDGNSVQRGFDQASIMSGITGVQSGIQNISTQLCNGFAGVEQGANARQIANMQTAFANQMAMSQGFADISSQFADCCCKNQLIGVQTQNIIQNEASATRFADLNNTRDILENCNRNNQAILDKLCQLELDGKQDRINDLERQLTMANLAASQTAQTSRILADNAAQTVALEQYLNPVPVPAYIVQNPNACTTSYQGCGCGSF